MLINLSEMANVCIHLLLRERRRLLLCNFCSALVLWFHFPKFSIALPWYLLHWNLNKLWILRPPISYCSLWSLLINKLISTHSDWILIQCIFVFILSLIVFKEALACLILLSCLVALEFEAWVMGMSHCSRTAPNIRTRSFMNCIASLLERTISATNLCRGFALPGASL